MASIQPSLRDFICWNCSNPGAEGALFCIHCHHLQPLTPCDVFTRLGIEPRFDLEEKDLRQRYVSLQQQLHPDRFVTRTPQEKAYAIEQSAALNEAYDVLKNPYQRALHLLAVKGHSIEQEATIADPVLLEEILDLRERLMDNNSHARQDVVSLYNQALDALAQAFAHQRYEDAQAITHRLHYLQKMLLDCHPLSSSGTPIV